MNPESSLTYEMLANELGQRNNVQRAIISKDKIIKLPARDIIKILMIYYPRTIDDLFLEAERLNQPEAKKIRSRL